MAQVTVQQLAETVNASVERLLTQMKDAGLPHKAAEEAVSVITSYSIHYTKLYDHYERQVDRRLQRASPIRIKPCMYAGYPRRKITASRNIKIGPITQFCTRDRPRTLTLRNTSPNSS